MISFIKVLLFLLAAAGLFAGIGHIIVGLKRPIGRFSLMDCLLKNIPNGAKNGAQLIGEGIILLAASVVVFTITLWVIG